MQLFTNRSRSKRLFHIAMHRKSQRIEGYVTKIKEHPLRPLKVGLVGLLTFLFVYMPIYHTPESDYTPILQCLGIVSQMVCLLAGLVILFVPLIALSKSMVSSGNNYSYYSKPWDAT